MASRVGLVVLLAALAVVPLARADGDPASDYLVTSAAFVPPELGISAADAARLRGTVELARRRGYVVRVALIGSAYDLGSVGVLNRRPKEYARFLGQELAFVYVGRLLVVMPNGYGVARAGKLLPKEQGVADRLPPPGTSGPKLVQAGIAAVRALAAAAGIEVPNVAAPGGSRSRGSLVWAVVGGLAAALAVLAAAAIVLRRRKT